MQIPLVGYDPDVLLAAFSLHKGELRSENIIEVHHPNSISGIFLIAPFTILRHIPQREVRPRASGTIDAVSTVFLPGRNAARRSPQMHKIGTNDRCRPDKFLATCLLRLLTAARA